jgi:hypothetical protein
MPITWTANPQTRRVDAVGSGTVTAADWSKFIEEVLASGVRGYAKLLDFTHAPLEINAVEIQDIARTINRLAEDGAEPIGPAAFVGIDSATVFERLMWFDDRTATGRAMAIFPTRKLALDWLDGVQG